MKKISTVSLIDYPCLRTVIICTVNDDVDGEYIFTRHVRPTLGIHSVNISSALLDHYSRPRNVGSMPKTDSDVGTGLVGAPACGDVMKLQIRVDPGSNTISDVKFKTFGCGSAIASSSYLTELVRGMTLEDAGKIRNTEIAKELCLPPVKLHCSMLAEDAIKSAIQNYYAKNPKAAQTNLSGTTLPIPKVEVMENAGSATQPSVA
ncbi:MAG: iron-binding protein [Geoglossum umbratile]|nr:MAG: iron-binding protein [Geoglossum umbratile]